MTDLTPSQLAEANAIGAVSVHAGTEPIAGLGSARGSYHGIAWAANTQKMYAAPYNADNVLIVDYNYHDQCHRHHRSWRVAVLRAAVSWHLPRTQRRAIVRRPVAN